MNKKSKVNRYEADPCLQFDPGTVGHQMMTMFMASEQSKQYSHLVAENIQRTAFFYDVQLAGLSEELFDTDSQRVFAIKAHLDKLSLTAAKYENTFKEHKDKALEVCQQKGLEASEFTIDRFHSPEFVITAVDGFYYSQVGIATIYNAEPAESDILRAISYMKTVCAHDKEHTPLRYIDENLKRSLNPNLEDAIDLIQLNSGNITQGACDAIAVALLRNNPKHPGPDERFSDVFRFCAIEAYKEQSIRNDGIVLELVVDRENHSEVAAGFRSPTAALFKEKGTDRYHVVEFDIPHQMCTKKPHVPNFEHPGEPELILNWNMKYFTDQGIKVKTAKYCQFGMEGLDGYQQQIEQGGDEAKMAQRYLLLRVKGLAESGNLRFHQSAQINELNPKLIGVLKDAKKTYIQYLETENVPNYIPVLTDDEKTELENESEVLLRQYAINQAIVHAAGAANSKLSLAIDDAHDDEIKASYCMTYHKHTYHDPELIIGHFAKNGIEVSEDDIGVSFENSKTVINRKLLNEAIKSFEVDPKQFNNVSEGLALSRTKQYKEDVKPDIDRIGQEVVDQIQGFNSQLVHLPDESVVFCAEPTTVDSAPVTIKP